MSNICKALMNDYILPTLIIQKPHPKTFPLNPFCLLFDKLLLINSHHTYKITNFLKYPTLLHVIILVGFSCLLWILSPACHLFLLSSSVNIFQWSKFVFVSPIPSTTRTTLQWMMAKLTSFSKPEYFIQIQDLC